MAAKTVVPPFRPLQPEIDELRRGSTFGKVEVPPTPRLREYVACFWTMYTTSGRFEPFVMHGVPDGCVDVFFRTDFGSGCVVGLAARPIFVPVERRLRYFGLRFLPGKIRHFLKLPARGLYDKRWNLRDLTGPRLDEVEEAVLAAPSFGRRVEIVEALLLRMLERGGIEEDPRFLGSLDRIYRSGGRIDVETLAGAEGISERHLRRLFDEALGLSPKRLARIVRFQVALNRLKREEVRSLLDLALDQGYYDQPHFINDFRELYGCPPSGVGRIRAAEDVSDFSKTAEAVSR